MRCSFAPRCSGAAALAATPSETVTAFHAAIHAGDKERALALMSPDIMIYESGYVGRSRDEYASHHLVKRHRVRQGDHAQGAQAYRAGGRRHRQRARRDGDERHAQGQGHPFLRRRDGAAREERRGLGDRARALVFAQGEVAARPWILAA
ncbi:hypothetical protein LP420_23980 [Massilia sp. B-10]|nr:hypothetical protein LP420_23980 [Massilia sp. B-10]